VERLPHTVPTALVLVGSDQWPGAGIVADRHAAAWRAVLDIHERLNVPVAVRLTGVVIEAMAWHAPDVLERMRALQATGLVDVLGTTYSDAPFSCLRVDDRRRQLDEGFAALRRHLGVDPAAVTVAWAPLRVWSPEIVAPALTDTGLPNGGFRWVVLDDRVLLPVGGPQGGPRAGFDALGRVALLDGGTAHYASLVAEHLRNRMVAGTSLAAVPLSSHLVDWLPPRTFDDVRRCRELAYAMLRLAPDDGVLVWAADPAALSPIGYERSLDRLMREAPVQMAGLSPVLAGCPVPEAADVAAGVPAQLAALGAGEDYAGWWESSDVQPWRGWLESARDRTETLLADDRGELAELARTHVLAMMERAGRHELLAEVAGGDGDDDAGPRRPTVAADFRARASHARLAPTFAAAARWFGASPDQVWVGVDDVDDDGEVEVVLGNAHLHAVLAPARGARVVSLAVRAVNGGALVVGNPTDEWAVDDLHAAGKDPYAHPGALLLVGGEDDHWEVGPVTPTGASAVVELTNVEKESVFEGATLVIRLDAQAPALTATYHLPDPGAVVVAALSPDYRALRREGRRALAVERANGRVEAVAGRVRVWFGGVEDPADQAGQAAEPDVEEASEAPAENPAVPDSYVDETGYHRTANHERPAVAQANDKVPVTVIDHHGIPEPAHAVIAALRIEGTEATVTLGAAPRPPRHASD
jgi:starch synthase